jgi:hypothetical protein
MKYLTPYGKVNLANLDSLRYKYVSFAHPNTGDNTLFRTHIDLVSTISPKFDHTWVTLSQSGTTTKMLAVTGSKFHYAPTPDTDPVKCVVHAGGVCLVNPGPGNNQWTISVPRNDPGVCIKPSSGADPLDRTHGADREARV